MNTIHQTRCGVIPWYMLRCIEEHRSAASKIGEDTARQTEQLLSGRMRWSLLVESEPAIPVPSHKNRRVWDAEGKTGLPGKLVLVEGRRGNADAASHQAYDGSGLSYDFLAKVFLRNSLDGSGMRLDSTVHYSQKFSNALWDGERIIFGDGDGRLFLGFTKSVDVIGHELMHGLTQFVVGLSYAGQSGALNEHISDAFGIMIKQWALGLTVSQSDWLIGAGLFGPTVRGRGIRSMKAPGTAYNDPILGKDPQPAHMRDYVETKKDNGGVHLNSGILNRAFYLAAQDLGGYSWKTLGRVWYHSLTNGLQPDTDFAGFARSTVDSAGELYGPGGDIQSSIAYAWREVGVPVKLPSRLVPVPEEFPPARDADETTVGQSFDAIDRQIQTLPMEMEGENALMALQAGQIRKLVTAYRAIKPLLSALTTLPFIPTAWRAALTIFVGTLDAIAATASTPITDEFKAGKDLAMAEME